MKMHGNGNLWRKFNCALLLGQWEGKVNLLESLLHSNTKPTFPIADSNSNGLDHLTVLSARDSIESDVLSEFYLFI